jgi:2-succinyl-5-enolpyruvyl-6-hydroxy-3-cyclohexene-1-carboxylate synthase
VKQLSAQLEWPVFADIRSGVRLASTDEHIIDYFDHVLLSDRNMESMPDVIMHFGSVMTSKRFNEYIANCACSHYIHVADHPFRHDPAGVVTDRVEADIADFCLKLSEIVSKPENLSLAMSLKGSNDAVGGILNDFAAENADLSEIAVARLVSKHIEKDSGLFLGSSMPVRDMDMYADPGGNSVRVFANRGASGIDGGIATAAGLAGGLQQRVTAIIGDLAFLHDVNSLALLRNDRWPVSLIV